MEPSAEIAFAERVVPRGEEQAAFVREVNRALPLSERAKAIDFLNEAPQRGGYVLTEDLAPLLNGWAKYLQTPHSERERYMGFYYALQILLNCLNDEKTRIRYDADLVRCIPAIQRMEGVLSDLIHTPSFRQALMSSSVRQAYESVLRGIAQGLRGTPSHPDWRTRLQPNQAQELQTLGERFAGLAEMLTPGAFTKPAARGPAHRA